MLGRDVWQLYHAYLEAALEGERTGFERQLVTPGRPPIWIRVDYYPDRGATGRVRGLLVTYSDVDHLKRLELEAGQREHRLRLVTDSVGVPILYVDRQSRIRFANRPYADWIGAPEDDLLGHALRDVLPADALAELSPVARARVRRRVGHLRAAREEVRRRDALDAAHALPRPRDLRADRRRLHRDDGHRGRRPHPRRDEGPAGAAEALRRQHSRPDRLPRPRAALHLRQPDLRQPRVQAAGGDLRPHAVRRAAGRGRRLPAPDPQARAGRRARRVRAHRHDADRRQALDARAHRAGLRRRRQGARPLLHRVRHPRPQAHRAGARRARAAAAGSSPTTSPSRSSTSTTSGATCS